MVNVLVFVWWMYFICMVCSDSVNSPCICISIIFVFVWCVLWCGQLTLGGRPGSVGRGRSLPALIHCQFTHTYKYTDSTHKYTNSQIRTRAKKVTARSHTLAIHSYVCTYKYTKIHRKYTHKRKSLPALIHCQSNHTHKYTACIHKYTSTKTQIHTQAKVSARSHTLPILPSYACTYNYTNTKYTEITRTSESHCPLSYTTNTPLIRTACTHKYTNTQIYKHTNTQIHTQAKVTARPHTLPIHLIFLHTRYCLLFTL